MLDDVDDDDDDNVDDDDDDDDDNYDYYPAGNIVESIQGVGSSCRDRG